MRAVFVGRFQPFHLGHLHAVEDAEERYDLVLAVGSSNKERTRENPLTFEERKKVLDNCLEKPEIVGLEDRDDNSEWMDQVEEELDFDVCISGNSLVRRLFSERGHEVEDPDYLKPEVYSGTEIRRRVVEGENWRKLVPGCSLEALEEVGFEEAVKESYENDG
ncbi:MAG: nicotinamide-nucleotide adenylyltransferase [Candidatus Nanohaloarchaea archaeon]|nr:nicotinamide-nucleotide adenylyltransferase [Candidatus Nanohaloarchaea archaeon]